MSWSAFLFSFRGRVTRSDFWLRFVLPFTGAWFILLALGLIIRFVPMEGARSNPWAMITPLGYAVLIASNWAAIVVGVKRFHDRDRSGWFLLAYLIPLVGPLWVLLELGFWPGTVGPNRFGADPRG